MTAISSSLLQRMAQISSKGAVEIGKSPSPAEDVGIVLLESAHSGEALQSPAEFIPVQHPEIRHPDRQLPVRARPVPKH